MFFLQNDQSAMFYAIDGVLVSKEDARDLLQYLTEQGVDVNSTSKVKFPGEMSLFGELFCV